jgi:hypothetical protein
MLCQQLGLFGENLVAIDGSKFKEVNNRGRNFTSAKLKRRMEEIESSINRYLTALDEADQQELSIAQPKATRLQEKIDKLKAQMKELQVIEIQLNESPDKQVSLTDPDSRSMMTRGTGIVGYNVQTAVDTQHHLIVAHEVTNVGSDRDQLSSMAKQAREAMAADTLSVVADRGYFKSEQILACHNAGITAYVPKPMTSGAKADGRFNNDAFVYDAAKNEYICPAGEALIWHYSYVEKGLKLHRYWSSKCQGCALKLQCTPSTERRVRRVRRWEHEDVLEKMQLRLSKAPEMTVEHPFGTLKQWMGATHFLTRKLAGVSAEMSLHVLAYNLKRVMKIIGTTGLMKALTV